MLIKLMFHTSASREPENIQLSRVPNVGELILNGEIYYRVTIVTHILNPYRGDPLAHVAVEYMNI